MFYVKISHVWTVLLANWLCWEMETVWLAVSFCATILQKKTCPMWPHLLKHPSLISTAAWQKEPHQPMLYSNNEDPSKLYKRTHQGERANKLKQRVSHFWQLMVSYTPMRGAIKRGQNYPVAFRLFIGFWIVHRYIPKAYYTPSE